MKAHIRALITAALKGPKTTAKANPLIRAAQHGRWETSAAGSRAIPLTRGCVALVDAALYDWLSTFTWYASFRYKGRSVVAKTHVGGTTVMMHRLIMDAPPGVLVDHKNAGDGLMPDGFTIDNRRENLRLATNAQNQHNTGLMRLNTTGYKGVGLCSRTGMWLAAIKSTWDGGQRHLYLGKFSTKERAALAYDQAARQLHDLEFIRPNFPDLAIADAAVQKRIDRFLHRTGWVHSRSETQYITWQSRARMWRVEPRLNGRTVYAGMFRDLSAAKDALEAYFIQQIVERSVDWPEHYAA